MSQRDNFWEPIYEPGLGALAVKSIDDAYLKSSVGVKNISIDINDFSALKSKIIKDLIFNKVDFTGKLECDSRKKVIFEGCLFDGIAFNRSAWENVKFRNCRFISSSFSLAKFTFCEFRDCHFEKIGISGNEMTIKNCHVDPDKFLNAAYTNTNKEVLTSFKSSPRHQLYRLEKTKSIVASKLLENSYINNDIDLKISAIKQTKLLAILKDVKKSLYDITRTGLKVKVGAAMLMLSSVLEFCAIYVVGFSNGWGLKVAKPLIMALAFNFCYAVIYVFLLNLDPLRALIRSIEYWFLFGYTKYQFSDDMSIFSIIVILSNALLGMLWFAIVIPVLFRKSSHE